MTDVETGPRPGALLRTSQPRGVSGTVGVVLVLVAAGMLFAASANAARGTQLRSDRSDAQSLIDTETKRNAELERGRSELQTEVDAESARVNAGSAALGTLTAEADALARPAGASAVVGPGLSIALDDAPRSARIPDGIGPDDLVVHQQDVQAVVNALWAGGAEAMMLQDQRVISTSAVRCVGNTLILQGRVYSPPYTIKAIGDVGKMRAALNRSREISIYQEYVDALGLGYDLEQSAKLTFPAYAGSLTLQHAEVLTDPTTAPIAPTDSATPKETGS